MFGGFTNDFRPLRPDCVSHLLPEDFADFPNDYGHLWSHCVSHCVPVH
jgi:hypothetical protein